MNLIDGKYLKHEICAFGGNSKNIWVIVYDGKHNYMLFNSAHSENVRRYNKDWMPTNNVDRGTKDIEFYSNFNNALNNLMRVVVNDNFKPTFLKEVFE